MSVRNLINEGHVINIDLVLPDRVETIDGSAVQDEDYEPLNEILTFEPNEREKEVTYFILQGSPFKFTGYLKHVSSAYSETTETCNTGIERKFC